MAKDFKTSEGQGVTISKETHSMAKKLAAENETKISLLVDEAVREYVSNRKRGKKRFKIF